MILNKIIYKIIYKSFYNDYKNFYNNTIISNKAYYQKSIKEVLAMSKNITFNVSREFVITSLQSRFDDVKDLFGNKASRQLWTRVMEVVEACGIGDNVTSPAEFVDNYLINGEFVSKQEYNFWLVGDSEELLHEISEKWLEYCENNACLYDDEYACLSF